MRGCELKGVGKEGGRFDFRCARSLPLGPTITGRVTGAYRNLHGDATECQGDCLTQPRKMSEKMSPLIIYRGLGASRNDVDARRM
jgi:hypothetical protein